MAIPTHDITCITKAFPTSCPSCSAAVWYFSCTCGSKIYFNELGYPWEQHICRKYFLEQQIRLIQDMDRLSDTEIYSIITDIEKKHNRVLSSETEEMLTDILGKRKFSLAVITYEPDMEMECCGKVMELNNPVNIFKKLGYDAASLMSVKLLGMLGRKQWAQLVIRSNPDKRNQCYEYTVFAEQDYLKNNPLRKGSTIAGLLKAISHPKGKIWQITFHQLT